MARIVSVERDLFRSLTVLGFYEVNEVSRHFVEYLQISGATNITEVPRIKKHMIGIHIFKPTDRTVLDEARTLGNRFVHYCDGLWAQGFGRSKCPKFRNGSWAFHEKHGNGCKVRQVLFQFEEIWEGFVTIAAEPLVKNLGKSHPTGQLRLQPAQITMKEVARGHVGATPARGSWAPTQKEEIRCVLDLAVADLEGGGEIDN